MWKSWWLENFNKSHLLHSQAYIKKMRNYNPLGKKNWASPSLLDGGRRTNELLTNLKTIRSHPFERDEYQYLLTVWEQEQMCTCVRIGSFQPLNPYLLLLVPGGENKLFMSGGKTIFFFKSGSCHWSLTSSRSDIGYSLASICVATLLECGACYTYIVTCWLGDLGTLASRVSKRSQLCWSSRFYAALDY